MTAETKLRMPFSGNRFREFDRYADQYTTPFVVPSLDNSKEMFACVQSLSSRAKLPMNLSRAVIDDTWHVGDIVDENNTERIVICGSPIEIIVFRGRIQTEACLSFLNNARRLDEHGQTDIALDIIFDQIDEMLLAGEFFEVDQLLLEISPEDYSVELLLGILTITLPAKKRLLNRCELFTKVKTMLYSSGEKTDSLLVGLE